MSSQMERLLDYLENSQFIALCNELGWNHCDFVTSVDFDGLTYDFKAIAEKCGFLIFQYQLDTNQPLPYRVIDQLYKSHHEHLTIVSNKDWSIWQWALRKRRRKPIYHQILHDKNKNSQDFAKRISGIAFTLDEEDHLSIVDVIHRVSNTFHEVAHRKIGEVKNPRPRIKSSSEVDVGHPDCYVRVDLMENGGVENYEVVYGFKIVSYSNHKRTIISGGLPLAALKRDEHNKLQLYMLNAAGNPTNHEQYQLDLILGLLKLIRKPDFKWGVVLPEPKFTDS